MSKPMVITLPAIMILLDYWPLSRFRTGAELQKGNLFLWQLKGIMEKGPNLHSPPTCPHFFSTQLHTHGGNTMTSSLQRTSQNLHSVVCYGDNNKADNNMGETI